MVYKRYRYRYCRCYCSDVTTEVRRSTSVSTACDRCDRHPGVSSPRRPPCPGPRPPTVSAARRLSPGTRRRSSGGGWSASLSQVPQGVDTTTTATRVRQAVSHRARTGRQTTSQTHLQGNHDQTASTGKHGCEKRAEIFLNTLKT